MSVYLTNWLTTSLPTYLYVMLVGLYMRHGSMLPLIVGGCCGDADRRTLREIWLLVWRGCGGRITELILQLRLKCLGMRLNEGCVWFSCWWKRGIFELRIFTPDPQKLQQETHLFCCFNARNVQEGVNVWNIGNICNLLLIL